MKEKLRDLFHILGLDIRRWDDMSVFSRQLVHILKYLEIEWVFDVGAHHGEYAKMLFRGGYDGKVLSFEPLSRAYETLQFLARDNPQWRIAPRMAIGDVEGEMEINIAGGNSSSSSLLSMNPVHLIVAPHTAYTGREKVEVHRLQVPISGVKEFLKIDTQGYEMQVLEGATGVIDRIKGVQVEMSTEELYEGQSLDYEISEWLQDHGFQLWALNPFLYNPKSGRLLQYDAIFIKENDDESPANAKA